MDKCCWLFLGMLFLSSALSAQHRYRIGLLPQVNLNVKLGDRWRLNSKVEMRPLLTAGRFGEAADGWQYGLTDLALLGAVKLSAQQTLSGGYLARFVGQEIHHRTIQQFSLVNRFPSFRFGQRFAADQTFVPDEAMALRLRYRLSFEFPLNGESVDPGEAYLKLNHEYLNSFQEQEYDLEIRIAPSIGLVFTDRNKLETGLDYRLDGFLDAPGRSTIWWSVAWYRAW